MGDLLGHRPLGLFRSVQLIGMELGFIWALDEEVHKKVSHTSSESSILKGYLFRIIFTDQRPLHKRGNRKLTQQAE